MDFFTKLLQDNPLPSATKSPSKKSSSKKSSATKSPSLANSRFSAKLSAAKSSAAKSPSANDLDLDSYVTINKWEEDTEPLKNYEAVYKGSERKKLFQNTPLNEAIANYGIIRNKIKFEEVNPPRNSSEKCQKNKKKTCNTPCKWDTLHNWCGDPKLPGFNKKQVQIIDSNSKVLLEELKEAKKIVLEEEEKLALEEEKKIAQFLAEGFRRHSKKRRQSMDKSFALGFLEPKKRMSKKGKNNFKRRSSRTK
jgi:hypothetical protein